MLKSFAWSNNSTKQEGLHHSGCFKSISCHHPDDFSGLRLWLLRAVGENVWFESDDKPLVSKYHPLSMKERSKIPGQAFGTLCSLEMTRWCARWPLFTGGVHANSFLRCFSTEKVYSVQVVQILDSAQWNHLFLWFLLWNWSLNLTFPTKYVNSKSFNFGYWLGDNMLEKS